jgi:hypothetical protein
MMIKINGKTSDLYRGLMEDISEQPQVMRPFSLTQQLADISALIGSIGGPTVQDWAMGDGFCCPR